MANGGTGGTGSLSIRYWCPHGHIVEPYDVDERNARSNALFQDIGNPCLCIAGKINRQNMTWTTLKFLPLSNLGKAVFSITTAQTFWRCFFIPT